LDLRGGLGRLGLFVFGVGLQDDIADPVLRAGVIFL
jgi:hypothetical protein